MNRVAPLLLALAVIGCSGSGGNGPRCDQICSKFVNVCQFPAWTSVEQCKQGCLEDMYRRADATEVLDCYAAAADPPTVEQAAVAVDEGVARGVYAIAIGQGTFNRDSAIVAMTERLTCDPFAVVQCKTDSVLVEPDVPLVREQTP